MTEVPELKNICLQIKYLFTFSSVSYSAKTAYKACSHDARKTYCKNFKNKIQLENIVVFLVSPIKKIKPTPHPINDDSIINGACTLPEEVDLKNISLFGDELACLLKCSQDNLGTCNSATLCQRQRTLKHVYNMEKIHLERMENIKTPQPTITDSLENAKKECRRRIVHTEQTMLLIQYLLDGITVRP